MTCCDSVTTFACWSLFGLGDEGRRKLSVKPVFSRWKIFGKGRDQERECLLQDRGSLLDGSDSAVRTWSAELSRDDPEGRSPTNTVKRFAVLKAFKDVQRGNAPGSMDTFLESRSRAIPQHLPDPLDPANCGSKSSPAPTALLLSDSKPHCTWQHSRFLALPQEIRDEIYAYVFYSTRLTMGRRVTCAPPLTSTLSSPSSATPLPTSSTSSHCSRRPSHLITRIKPARHSLALFRVCRQITRELRTDDAWIGQVLFNFEDAATMLDVLGSGFLATPERRSKICEVRVREGGLFVRQLPSPPSSPTLGGEEEEEEEEEEQQQQQRQRFLLLGGLMRLLPGLQLDRLTILPSLPCRLHKSTQCHRHPAAAVHLAGPGGVPLFNRAAPHEMLAELLHAGSGWRELCYVHHDTAMLTADRRRPNSLEAMMVNMGYWDADMDTYDDVFASAERQERQERQQQQQEDEAMMEQELAAAAAAGQEQQQQTSSELQQHQPPLPRYRLGSFFASFAQKKEYRLPRWRNVLTERDGVVCTASDSSKAWNVSIDAVIDEGFYDGDDAAPRSTVDVYGLRAGLATLPMETLADVHASRVRGEDFMVIVRRGMDGADSSSSSKMPSNGSSTTMEDSGKVDWTERVDNPYPFQDGDPRTLGYGSRWEALRPVLFPWDHMPTTRCRRDRYEHRDEYVLRSQRRRHTADEPQN